MVMYGWLYHLCDDKNIHISQSVNLNGSTNHSGEV